MTANQDTIVEFHLKARTKAGETFDVTLASPSNSKYFDLRGEIMIGEHRLPCTYNSIRDSQDLKGPEYPCVNIRARDIKPIKKRFKITSARDINIKLCPESAAQVTSWIEQKKDEIRISREREQAEAEGIAKSIIARGLHYDFGCDCADSASILFDDGVPRLVQEAWERINGYPAELVKKHLHMHEIRSLASELGATETPSAPFSYGGYDFIGEQMKPLIALAREREEEAQRERRQREEMAQREQERIKAAAQGREIVVVECESAPHSHDLTGEILNSPAPQGGSFLIGLRVARPLWEKMKAAGAVYRDKETLEDFDMFDAEPGWRYSIAAIAELIKAGYALQIGRDVCVTVEALYALYEAEVDQA